MIPIVPARALHPRGQRGELADRPGAEDRDDVAAADLRESRPEPGRREDIARHDRLLIGDPGGMGTRLVCAYRMQAYSACSPSNGPVTCGPP
jgi:hypothetical protein